MGDSRKSSLYEFEGQLLSVKQICDKYPAYTEKIVRERLKQGAKSMADIERLRNQGVERKLSKFKEQAKAVKKFGLFKTRNSNAKAD